MAEAGIEGRFEVRAFRAGQAAAVGEVMLTNSNQISGTMNDLRIEHRMGDYLYHSPPGVHAYEHGTIHANKL
jgi:hypothetical protein